MNPFDFHGPQFLAFYILLVVAIHLLWRPLARFFCSPTKKVELPLRRFDLANLDPYLLAYLRGQEPETARVAIVSLIDRGLLHANEDKLTTVVGMENQGNRPLEREILGAFASQQTASIIFKHSGFLAACRGLRDELVKLGLLPGTAGRAWVVLLRLGMLAVLAGVAILKIRIAFERGHSNVGFLVILSLVATIAMLKRDSPKRTRQGDALLDELKLRYARLEERSEQIQAGGGSHELVLVAAIFGLAALPTLAHAQVQALFPLGMSRSSAGSGGCGSSCGCSSCGGGGGCGGGGCGGGCGGCG
jgi:uncharacterized protein (TIGR04222 family)